MKVVDFVLGNDLAGTKVCVTPVVSEKPCEVPEPLALKRKHPEVFTACGDAHGGVLLRKPRKPRDRPADDSWTVVTQIVLPESFRQEVVHLGHELTPITIHGWSFRHPENSRENQ